MFRHAKGKSMINYHIVNALLLTLFQPEGTDYVHHITASNPGFDILLASHYILGITHLSFETQDLKYMKKVEIETQDLKYT